MEKTTFLTIYPTFEQLETVKRTLPTVVEETRRHDARLIVHDSSVNGRDEKWAWLRELNADDDFFLLLSDNLSMAHARNMCLALGQELYAPEFICMIEDDHGYKEGFIPAMVEAMRRHYGKPSPNGMPPGLFTGCGEHFYFDRFETEDGHETPAPESFPTEAEGGPTPEAAGGVNSCCRCAPTAHWNNVLKGYDTDEYLISTFQTSNVVRRNYHKGFTSMFVAKGAYMFSLEMEGRGSTENSDLKLWDNKYCASDPRSRYRGKPGLKSEAASASDKGASKASRLSRFLRGGKRSER